MQVLIAGGTGFLGKALTKKLQEGNHYQVTWLSRNKKAHLPEATELITYDQLKYIEKSFDIIINLAGAGIADKCWTDSRKQLLIDSRLKPTQALLDYMKRVPIKPKLFISGSAIGWYGVQDKIVDETSSSHDEFTHQLCDNWEKLANSATTLDVPVVLLRTGVVISSHGGIIKRLQLPFSLGVGGKLGDGKQLMSWISLVDWVRAVSFIIDEHLRGAKPKSFVYNLTAPTPISNLVFTQTLGRWLHRPVFVSQPRAILEFVLGEMSILLLGSQHVIPKSLLDKGFNFFHQEITQALGETNNAQLKKR